MKKSEKKTGAKSAERNLLRGLVGAVKDKSFDSRLSDKGELFRAKRRVALLEARRALQVEGFAEYLRWFNAQTAAQLPEEIVHDVPTVRSVDRILPTRPLSLEKELHWVSLRLAAIAPFLSTFRRDAGELQRIFWSGNKVLLSKARRRFERTYGSSLWLVELTIAARQTLFGLEKQKRYTTRLRKHAGRGVMSFVAYYVSIRNEPSTTMSRFASDVGQVLRDSKLSASVQSYLRFRLLGEPPLTFRAAAAVLTSEQSTTEIDLYETTVSVLSTLAVGARGPVSRDLVLRTLDTLAEIDDWRLERIREIVSPDKVTVGFGPPSLSSLLKGDVRRGLRQSLQVLRQSPGDFAAMLSAAYALSARSAARTPRPDFGRSVIDRMAALFTKGADFVRSQNELTKFTTNYRGLDVAPGISSVLMSEVSSFSAPVSAPYFRRQLAHSVREPFDDLVARDVKRTTEASELDIQGTVVAALIEQHPLPPTVNRTVGCYLRAASAALQSDWLRVLAITAEEATHQPASVMVAMQLLRVRSFIELDDIRSAMRLAASLAAENPSLVPILPIRQIVGEKSWPELSSLSADISLPIVVDLYWRDQQNSDAATLRRFAFEEYMASTGIRLPSELDPKDRIREHIYFLRNVCVPQVMDMYSEFETSRALSEERRNICAVLRVLDAEHSSDYDVEIFEITSQHEVEDGLQLVNMSRVHADTDAISEWAVSELTEDFQRYIDLRAIEPEVDLDLTGYVVRLLSKSAGRTGSDAFALPDSEAETLLARMVLGLADRFQFDPNHGLDSYLSRRVRHGSIVNFLRGPVEKSGLITEKDATSRRYKANDTWIPKLTDLSPADQIFTSAQFEEFSRRFDAIGSDLKDVYLHVRNSDHRQGMIMLPITASTMTVLKRHLEDDPTFDGFLRGSYAVFWAQLEHSFAGVREYLVTEVKSRVADAFDRLKAAIGGRVSSSESYASLMTTIASTSTEVQNQVDVIAAWFSRGNLGHFLNEFTATQAMRIALASALNASRGFEPALRNEFASDTPVTVESLVNLTECVWVAIENVHVHSGLRSPKIDISGGIRDGSTIALTIVSDVSPEKRTSAAESELSHLRESVAAGDIEGGLRKEGKTGMKKISAVATNVTFNFADENKFIVSFELPCDQKALLRKVSETVGCEVVHSSR